MSEPFPGVDANAERGELLAELINASTEELRFLCQMSVVHRAGRAERSAIEAAGRATAMYQLAVAKAEAFRAKLP